MKVVVIYSGGMDSFTVLHRAIKTGHEVLAVSFNYGQRHNKELDYARRVCAEAGVVHDVVDITAMQSLMSNSSLMANSAEDIPEGHYAAENMKSTVVPNRNMILISLAIGYAVNEGASEVWYGAHSGDHTIYPDCRPEFVEAMQAVSLLANFEPVKVVAPYLYDDKIVILRDGLDMGLDYGQTWTCYNGREKACGKCGSCVERLEAFTLNNAQDPLEYEA
ncbi:7-cyano-7-deazaguanine synthase QueC [Umboniibacter marinipuniceus]|uniref:7-cyano-7-deazaguanine synthase n=1 Tax=Umboniibacter marinipuniceus TaxID=569599 RepID=A0A3M0AEQ7_9GAMM|nr:7-cyano-7-deazaguanine synthase QueC [Umboniibacter marinipuniceus]RMA77672.1 preQ(0) biosynthesis protein QueC [Umboniibacter marinipuniceus]